MKHRGLFAGVIALALATGSAAFAAETAPAAPAAPPAEVAGNAAAPAAPIAAAPAAAAPAATPLAPRAAAKPLNLAPKEESTPFGYKLLAGLGLAGAAGLWYHKKKKDAAGGEKKKKPAAKIDIVSRQSVGVRNEIFVVDVEGTRLLIGMTPGAMQTLAVLDQPMAAAEEIEETEDEVEEARPAPKRHVEPAPVKAAAAIDDEDELPPVSVIPPKPRAATNNVAALDQKVRSLLAARPAPTPTTPSQIVPKRRRGGNNNAKTARIAGQAKGLLLAMNEGEIAGETTTARAGEM
jgi:flagellar biogenesis protein FliO